MLINVDHHCEWIGKCIGKGNLGYFNLFIKSSLGGFVLALVCLLS